MSAAAAPAPAAAASTSATPARARAARPDLLGVAMSVGASLLFAVNGSVAKVVLGGDLSSLQLVELRSAGAAVVLVALVAVRRPAALRTTRRELGFLAVYGTLGIALVQWLYFVAIARMPVSVALLLEYTAPLLVALWVRFVRGEAVRPRVWAALALSLGGLALVAQVWEGVVLDGVGVAAAFAAAVALAAYYLMGERGLAERDPLSLSAWTFLFATVLWSIVQPWWTLPWGALATSAPLPGPLAAASAPLWALVVWIVLLGTVAPFLLVLGAIGRLGSTRVGVLGTFEPVLAGAVAWVVLGEVLEGVQLVGAAVVLVGIVLAETARRRRDEPPAQLPEGVAPG